MDELEIKKTAEEEKKKKEEETKKPKKTFFDVKEEVMAPFSIMYRVWASSPEEAYKLVQTNRALPSNISKPKLSKKIVSEIAVYAAGTSSLYFRKTK